MGHAFGRLDVSFQQWPRAAAQKGREWPCLCSRLQFKLLHAPSARLEALIGAKYNEGGWLAVLLYFLRDEGAGSANVATAFAGED